MGTIATMLSTLQTSLLLVGTIGVRTHGKIQQPTKHGTHILW